VSQKSISKALKYVPLGGFIFWAPSVLLHWVRGYRFSGLDALALTVLLPIITGLVLSSIGRHYERSGIAYPAVFCALLGIWLFGPIMISVSASFSGGGFSGGSHSGGGGFSGGGGGGGRGRH